MESHGLCASALSELNVKLDGELERFARRSLEAEFSYLIPDVRHEKVRKDGVIPLVRGARDHGD